MDNKEKNTILNKATTIAVNSFVEMGKTYADTLSVRSTALAGGNVIIQSVISTGSDYIQRQLSEAEDRRIAKSIDHIQKRISAQLASGKMYNEEFLSNNGKERKPCVEICEGVIQKCRIEYEELKVPFIANIFAVAPFISQYTKEEVFYRMMLAEKLTFRQLCILALLKNNEIVDSLKQTEYINGYKDYKLRALLIEIMDLYKLGLIQNFDRQAKRAYGLSGILTIIPYNLSLTKDGERQYELMDLSLIDIKYLVEIGDMLL